MTEHVTDKTGGRRRNIASSVVTNMNFRCTNTLDIDHLTFVYVTLVNAILVVVVIAGAPLINSGVDSKTVLLPRA